MAACRKPAARLRHMVCSHQVSILQLPPLSAGFDATAHLPRQPPRCHPYPPPGRWIHHRLSASSPTYHRAAAPPPMPNAFRR
eukprot:6740507-Prymnesium_polylepis.1